MLSLIFSFFIQKNSHFASCQSHVYVEAVEAAVEAGWPHSMNAINAARGDSWSNIEAILRLIASPLQSSHGSLLSTSLQKLFKFRTWLNLVCWIFYKPCLLKTHFNFVILRMALITSKNVKTCKKLQFFIY